MIHEVRLPRETRIYLRQIVRLQMGALSAVVGLHPGFSQAELQTALEAQGPTLRSAQVAGWIIGHQKPCDALQNFAQGSHSDKQALVTAMYQDVARLFWGCRDETLECRFDDDRRLPVYQKGAKDFLVAFYEQLRSGIPTDLFPCNPRGDRKYGREQFFNAYEGENPKQLICAICDEHHPITILRGAYFSDIEHYFPKSVYPHLVCHPYNLIPICRACNSAHSDHDPLVSLNGGAQRTLDEVFLPYRDESVRSQGAIRFDWEPFSSPALSFAERRADPDRVFRTKLEAFAEIYIIPDRWQRRIDSIGEQLWRQMSSYLRAEMDRSAEVDLFKAKTLLERLLSYFIEDLGATPWDYVLVWYLSHLLVTEVEEAIKKGETTAVFWDVLRAAIQEQPSGKHASRLIADDVLETNRKLYQP